MNIVEFIFLILQKFAPMDLTKREQLKDKASKWYRDLIEGKDGAEPNAVGKFFKKYGEEWYTQVGLAILFIPMVRWVHDFMNPEVEPDDKL